jgi:hypothetical protein
MTIAFDSTTESGLLQSDFNQIAGYLSNADDTTTLETRLDGIDTTVSNLTTTVTNNKTLAEKDTGLLGEVRQFALSISGAVTKATLQGKGWAICDGTTPASQGISSPTITTTPDLREKFLRHSANETTGGTGGTETHLHQWAIQANGTTKTIAVYASSDNGQTRQSYNSSGSATVITNDGGQNMTGSWYTSAVGTLPPYYDICYFIKVKV